MIIYNITYTVKSLKAVFQKIFDVEKSQSMQKGLETAKSRPAHCSARGGNRIFLLDFNKCLSVGRLKSHRLLRNRSFAFGGAGELIFAADIICNLEERDARFGYGVDGIYVV